MATNEELHCVISDLREQIQERDAKLRLLQPTERLILTPEKEDEDFMVQQAMEQQARRYLREPVPAPDPTHDAVHHPKHYNSHPSGVECIRVTEHMNFCLGNALKYIWRADHKNGVEDLKKALWYIQREIDRVEKVGGA